MDEQLNQTAILVADLPISISCGCVFVQVSENTLRSMFSKVGRVIPEPEQSYRSLCSKASRKGVVIKKKIDRDGHTSVFAFITFETRKEAENAINELNYQKIENSTIRLMLVDKDTINILKSGVGILLVKNLDLTIEVSQLHKTFAKYGDVISCKIATDNRKSLGYGFVQFRFPKDAERAITELKDTNINGKNIQIELFTRSQQLKMEDTIKKCCLKNLPLYFRDDNDLKRLFENFGTVKSSRIEVLGSGDGPIFVSYDDRGLGYCEMSTHKEAVRAVQVLNELEYQGKVLHCRLAMTEREKEDFLIKQMDDFLRNNDFFNPTPILVADLPIKMRGDDYVTDVTEEFLRSLFSEYGRIIDSTSGVVLEQIKDCEGRYFAIAFVTFETRKEAEYAIHKLNYKKIDNCPIRLILADEKTVRGLEEGFNKLIINDLDPKIEISQLHNMFAKNGDVISCDIATDDVHSLKYGYVQFSNPNEAENAMDKLSNSNICGRPLQLELFKKNQRPNQFHFCPIFFDDIFQEINPKKTFTKCFIKDLPKSIKTNEDLKGLFEKYGKVVSSFIVINESGESLGYGYCEMSTHEEAIRAIEGLNELEMEDRLLICRRAITIHEKEDLLIKQMDDFLRKYDFSNPTSILITDLPTRMQKGESLYDKNEEFLCSLFSEYGHVCGDFCKVVFKQKKDWEGQMHTFSFVNLKTQKDAENVINKLNYTKFDDYPIRLIQADEETYNILNSYKGCLHIKNLDPTIEVSQLHETFAKYGDIISCEIPINNGKSLGHGIVQFRFPKDAEKAMIDLKDTCIEGHPLQIEPYNRPQRIQLEETFKKCCITNLPKSIKTNEDLKGLFEKYGKVVSSCIEINKSGESLGYGYCEMSTHEEAIRAIEGLNEQKMEDRFLFCCRAMSIHEKRDFLYDQMDIFLRKYENNSPTPILVADLPIRMLGDYSTNIKTDEFLRSLFSEFGRVIDGPNGVVLKQEKDCDGNSYAFAFVTFGNKIDAESVIKKLNYTKIDNCPIRLILADEETCHVLNSLRSCLIVKNLDPTIEISQLHKAFSNYGDVISCQIPINKGKPLGYGIVQFRYQKNTKQAIADLKDIKIRGRLLKVESYSPEMMVLEKEHCLIKHMNDFIMKYDLNNPTSIDIHDFPSEKKDFLIDMFSKVCRVIVNQSFKIYSSSRSLSGRSQQTTSACFRTRRDAEIAINQFNHVKLDNVTIRLEISDLETSRICRSGVNKLLIKNLDPTIDERQLYEALLIFGEVISCEIPTYNGNSLGYGIAQFRYIEDAKQAMNDLKYKLINGHTLQIDMPEEPRKLRLVETFTICYIRNIPKSIKTTKDLKRLFDKFGTVVSSHIEFNRNGKGLGYGYCEMRTHEEAVNACEGLDEHNISGSVLHVSFEINEIVKIVLKAKQ